MRIFRFFANAAFIFGALFILNSCEVGLGESVDVTAPSLDISSPADGSIIMNTFNLRGTSSDDTYISLLKIVVSSTSNGRVYANYFATVDVVTKQWNVNINNRTKKADGTYAYEIPDGEYTVSVTAIDSAGRTTEKSRVYKIDNTPPVVVIKRPGATDSGGRADSFGKTIKLTGDIADSNSLSSLYFTWFREDASGKLEKIGTLREANISGVGLDLVIGKSYNEGDLSDDSKKRLNEMYEKIYGHKVSSAYNQSENVYCVVQVADSAKEFNPPASNIEVPKGFSEPGFTPTGNLSTGYYIYKTIYSNIYSDGGYGLSNSDIVSLLNGSSSRSDSSDILKYLEQNKIDTTREYSGVSVEDITANPDVYKIAKFSVNPNNSPYFEVSGYKVENDSAVPGKKKFSELANESKITVSVSSGRDQIEIDPDSVKVMLKKCDEYGNIIEGLDAETVTLINSQYEINEMSGDEKTAAQALRDDALTPDEIIKIVCGIGKRYAKRNYIVKVEGNDIDNNPIDTLGSELYGFVVTSLNKPPVVNVSDDPAEAPEDLSSYKNTELSFRGTGSYSTEEFEGLYCTVTAKNEKTGEAYPARENEVLFKLEDSDITFDTDAREFTWKFDLNDAKMRDIFNISGIPENSLCLYTVSFTAVDGDRNESAPSVRRIHVDTAAPVIDKISYTPKVMYNGNPCVNGKINVTVSVIENQELYDLEVGLKVEGEQDCLIKKNSSNLSAELEYNTYLIGDGKYKGNLLVIVKATDIAGNTLGPVTAETIFVDPESDLPQIKFGNAKSDIKDYSLIKESPSEILNLYDQGNNNKINATITDDDNVGMVILRYLAFDPDSMTYDSEAKKWNIPEDKWDSEGKTFFNQSEPDGNPYPMSAALMASYDNDETPMPEGLYLIRYEITDKKSDGVDSVTATNKGDEFVIGVDAAAPKITVSTQSGELVGANLSKTINGTLSDGNKVSLYRYSTNKNRNNGKYGDIDNKVLLIDNKSYSEYDGKWSDTIETTDNGDEFEYLAVDRFGRETKVKFDYRIDSVAPLIDVVSAGTTAYVGITNNSSVLFKGTTFDPKYVRVSDGSGKRLEDTDYEAMTDEQKLEYRKVDASGIEKITYKIKSSDGTVLDTGTASGTTSWIANIAFAKNETEFYTDAARVEFYAIDVAGNETNESMAAVRNVVVDTAVPEITLGTIVENNTREVPDYNNEGTYYIKDPYVINLKVKDANFESFVCNSQDGSPEKTSTGETDTYTYTYTVGAPTAGLKTYTFTAKDKAGQNAKISCNVYIDTEDPKVEISAVTPQVTANGKDNNINGEISVTGNASDDDKVVQTVLYINDVAVTGADGEVLTEPTDFSENVKKTSYSNGGMRFNYKIDTTKYDDKADLTIKFKTFDRSGRATEISGTYYVDQSTDIPTLEFSNADINLTDNSQISNADRHNLFGLGSNIIYGTVTDDDGIASISYVIDEGKPGEIRDSVAVSENPTTKSINLDLSKIYGGNSISSGNHTIKFVITDCAAGVKYNSPATVFAFDNDSPLIYVSKINSKNYVSGMWAPEDFTVEGTASDSSGIKSVYVKTIDGVSQTVPSDKGLVVTGEKTSSATWQSSLSNQNSGDHIVVYAVTDIYGRSFETTVTFKVDTVVPAFDTNYITLTGSVYGVNKVIKLKDYNENAQWFDNGNIKIDGIAGKEDSVVKHSIIEENPKLLTITYAENQSATPNMGVNKNFSSTITFDDTKQSSFSLTIEDEAGNKKTIGPFNVRIDSTAPIEPNISLYNEYDSEKSDVKSGSDVDEYVNRSTIYAKYSSSDETSGIAKVEIFQDATYSDDKLLAFKEAAADEVIDEGVISLNLSALPATTYTFAVRVTDRAGKESKKIAKPFIYDMIAPVVGYTTPSANAIVNKTITVRGTITETNVPKGIQTGETDLILTENADKWKAELYVKKEGDADYQKVSDAVIKIKSDKSWTFDIDTTNETYFADKKTATFQLRVTDAAGNTVQNTGNSLTVNVNQDSDRPIITLTSINTDGSTTLSNGTIKGTIEDDDGLTGLSMFVQIIDVDSNVSPKEEFSNDDSAWKAVTMDGSSWSYTYSKGEGVKIDGNYKIYFKIVDAKSSSFYTSDSGSQPKPKVVFEKGSPVVNGISFAIDQNPPTIVEFQYATSTTENGTYTDYADLNFNTVLGGSLYPYAKFRVKAEDSVLDTPDLRVSMTMLDNTPVVMTYNKAGETEGYFYTNPIRLNVAASSQYYAVASAADNSGNPSTRTINVIIDNTAPETISDMNISSSDEVTGSISLSGMASDDNKANSGIKEIFVYVPKKGTSSGNPVDEYGAGTVAQARDITSDEWKQAEWSATWAYTLNDSNIIGSIPLDKEAEIKPEYSGYREGAANIYQIPVWFKLVDKAGNIGYNVSNSIKFNPDADKPRTTIIYPEENLPGVGFNYVVLGGTIRFSGTAIDDEGIAGVYLQFDMDNDGEWDNGILSGDTMISGVKYTSAVVVDIPVAGGKGIRANGNQAWWYSLDVSGFGNTLLYDSVNKHCLKVRAIAIDTGALDAQKAGEWTDVLHISVNTNVPAFESVELKQFANANDPSAISTMPYLSGKYISGTNWYIVGSVTTAAGFAETPFSTEWIAGDNTVSLTKIPVGDGTIVKKYEFRIPVKVTSGTEWSVRITATDNTDNGGKSSDVTYSLNIDNDAPRFYSNDVISGEKIKLYRDAYGSSGIALDSTVDNSLKNSNGRWATISGRVTEEGSGYDKIVMYFKRAGSTTRVYNPMSADGRINIDTNKSSSSKNSGDIYINSEELPVRYLSGLGRTGGEYSITLPDEDSNIRTGGIVKIGGVYRLISTVSGTTVTLAESCATSYTEAEFVYGMVVDKNGESLDTDGITVKKDDGDGMVESFSKSGTNYTWDASIPSANIPDGPIEVHTVVFDAAGNNRHGFAETWVRNNSPRIARVTLATDLNGNSKYSDAGESQFFSVLSGDDGKTDLTDIQKKNITSNVWNLDTKAVLETAEYWSIKNGLQITPEFVGGTAPFYWTMSAAEGQQNISSPETFAGGTSSTKKIAANKTAFEIDNSAFDSGEYKNFENKNNTYRFSFWDSTEETVPGSSENGSQWSVLNIRMRQDVKDEVKPSVIVRPFYWYGRGLEKSTNTKEISESFTYGDVKGNTNYTALYTDAACKVPVTASTELSATVYAKKVVPVNSLYETFSENGHIEVETDLSFKNSPFTTGYGSGEMDMDPKVSGKIVIQGTAYDNVSLDSLWLSITDKAGNSVFTANNAVSETAPSGIDNIYVCAGKYSAGSWTTPVAELGTDYWQFEVDDEYFNQFGHRVNWTLTLDTEHIDGVALADVKVTVLAVDRSSQISNVISKTAASGEYNSFSMDVVPYVTKVYTTLSKLKSNNWSVYGRTALGHYPVGSNDIIYLYGFNLGDDTNKPFYGTYELDEPVEGGTEVSTYPSGDDYSTYKVVTFPVSNVTASGKISLKVNGVESLNNSNKNDASGDYADVEISNLNIISGDVTLDVISSYAYNRQGNKDNNNILTDDVELDVWLINNQAARPISGIISDPVMKINPVSGQLGFAFTNGPLYFSMPGTTTATDKRSAAGENSYAYWQGSFDFLSSIGLHYDASGHTYGCAAGGDINTSQADRFGLMTDRWGLGQAGQNGSYQGQNCLRLEGIGQYGDRYGNNTGTLNFDKQRIQNPSFTSRRVIDGVGTKENATDIFMAYFDQLNGEIRFRYGRLLDSANTKGSLTNIELYKDGNDSKYGRGFGQFVDEYANTNKDANFNAAGNINKGKYTTTFKQVIADEAGSGLGYSGQYVDIDIDKNGYVVLVWYDSINGNLMYSYNTTPTTIRNGVNSAGWNTATPVIKNAGEYCKIAADADGGIHIAAYDGNNGDLVYAYAPSYDGDFKTCIVDSYAIVGQNLTLDVGIKTIKEKRYAIPYIGYYSLSSARPKTAYIADPATFYSGTQTEVFTKLNGSTDEAVTGIWEISLIPTLSRVPQDRINIGLWKSDDGAVIAPRDVTGKKYIGDTAGSENSLGQYFGKCFGNGTSNQVLAYSVKRSSTSGFIETAQMK